MSNLHNSVAHFASMTETWATAVARGKDVFTDMGMRLFEAVRNDEAITDPVEAYEVARSVYVDVRTRAEVIASLAHKPLSPQSDKSRAAQVSKLANFPHLGLIARDHDSVTEAVEYAREQAKGGYTKAVKALVAVKGAIAKDPRVADDLTVMGGLIDDALEPAKALASEAVTKAMEAFAATLSEHDEAVNAAAINLAPDYVKSIMQRMNKLCAELVIREKANVPA